MITGFFALLIVGASLLSVVGLFLVVDLLLFAASDKARADND